MLTVLTQGRKFRSTRGERPADPKKLAQQLQSMAAKNPKFGRFLWVAVERESVSICHEFVVEVRANTRSEAHAKVRRILLHTRYDLIKQAKLWIPFKVVTSNFDTINDAQTKQTQSS